MHVGASLAYPKETFGLLKLHGSGGSSTSAWLGVRSSGGSSCAAPDLIPEGSGPTLREMPLPPSCLATPPYSYALPSSPVDGRKSAWTERIMVMTDSAMQLLDPKGFAAYQEQPFEVDRSLVMLYRALTRFSRR